MSPMEFCWGLFCSCCQWDPRRCSVRLLQLQDNSWGSRKSEAEGASKLFSDSSQKATEEKKKKSLKSSQDVLILNVIQMWYKSLTNKQELCKQLLEFYTVCSNTTKTPKILTVFSSNLVVCQNAKNNSGNKKTYRQNGLATFPKLWIAEMHWDPACSHTPFEQQTSGLNSRSHHRRETLQLLLPIQQQASPSLVSKNLKEANETT